MNIGGPSFERTVTLRCKELESKTADKLWASANLLRLMPPSDVSWVVWDNDRTSTRMLVTSTFAKAFVSEFVHTADAFALKADLITQHSLNDGASATHISNLVERNAALAGTAQQAVALSGTGVAPDAPSNALCLGGVTFNPSEMTVPERLQLAQMIVDDKRKQAEHERRMVKIDEERAHVSEMRAQNRAASQAQMTETSMKLTDALTQGIRRKLEDCTDFDEREALELQLEFLASPTCWGTPGTQCARPPRKCSCARGRCWACASGTRRSRTAMRRCCCAAARATGATSSPSCSSAALS